MNHENRNDQELENENRRLKERNRQLEGWLAEMERTEEARCYREVNNESFTEKLADMVWIMDRDLRTRYVSPAIKRVLGFTSKEHLALNLDKQITPASIKVALDTLKRELKIEREGSGDPDRMTTLEVEMYHKDGSTRWLEFILGGIRNNEGVLTDIYGVSRDITKRRRAEEELQQTRDNFRRTLDESPLGVRIVSGDGDTLYANRRILDIYGYQDIDELRDTPAKERYTPESYAEYKLRKENRKRGSDGNSEYDISIVRKNGEVRHLQVLRKRILWDGEWQYQVIYQDVTERKRMEEALRKREEYFRELVENISDIIVTMDEGGTITYVSPSVERIAGYRPDELIGTCFLDIFISEDLPAAFSEYARAMISRDVALPSSFRIRHNNGAILVMEGVCKNLLHNPAIASFVANIRDVTEKRRTEKERVGLEAKLQLAQKMEAIGALAGGVAHDFNNLLAGIQGHVTMCLLHSERTHPNYERLKRVGEIVDSGAKLTGQLLGFSREQQREIRSADMNEVLDRTLMMFGRTRKEISIWRHCAEDLWAVEVDRGQMEQVIMNLCLNAVEASRQPSRIDVYTACEEVAADQAAALELPPGRYVRFGVRDRGCGMDAATVERVFEPFFTTKPTGRGMGLAATQGIVHSHKGQIRIDSTLGKGTTVSVWLPVAPWEASQQTSASKPSVSTLPRGNETVLLIDEQKTDLQTAEASLSSLGYCTVSRADLASALAFLETNSDDVHLVLLDVDISHFPRVSPLRQIRKHCPEVPVLLTGRSLTDAALRRLRKQGAMGLVRKPFELPELAAAVRSCLDMVPGRNRSS